MSKLNKHIFHEINQLRENPSHYIPKLEEWKSHYDKKMFKHLDRKVLIKTKDGPLAVTKAINALRKQEPRAPLRRCVLLEKAARAHAHDIGPKGIISNKSKGGKVKKRLKK